MVLGSGRDPNFPVDLWVMLQICTLPRVVENLRFHRISTKQKRRSTGPGAKRPLDLSGLKKNAHSTELRGGGWHHSAKAARGEDLDIEEPVACRYASAFHFHTTLPDMLGSMLIRDEII